MQEGDAVRPSAEAQAHDGHVEHGRVAAVVVLGPEGEDALDGQAVDRHVAAEVLRDEVAAEPVDAGGHGRVRREDRRGADGLERRVEREALLDELADALDAEEPRVALVGVVDLGLRRAGEARPQAQRAHAAHAEQQLLLEAVLAAAAVEAVGHLARGLVVAGHVRVEQEQRHAADGRDPHVRVERATPGQGERDARRRAVVVAQEGERQAVRVEERVRLDLPAVACEGLLEVAGAVEEPDADDRHAEVARALEVVAGEDTEAAGVLGQHRRDAELGREVRDRGREGAATLRRLRGTLLVPQRVVEVVAQVGRRRPHALDEGAVGGELREAFGTERTEQRDGVAVDRRPRLGVDTGEQVARGRVPGPAQVVRELVQVAQLGGQQGADGEPSDGSHGDETTQPDAGAHPRAATCV